MNATSKQIAYIKSLQEQKADRADWNPTPERFADWASTAFISDTQLAASFPEWDEAKEHEDARAKLRDARATGDENQIKAARNRRRTAADAMRTRYTAYVETQWNKAVAMLTIDPATLTASEASEVIDTLKGMH